MESNQREDSSEEVDQPEQDTNCSSNDVAAGMGRSYECVFCKRGFTTAQALGGHMNIHRKDRARNRPSRNSSVNSSKHEEIYEGPKFYQPQIPSYPPRYSPAHEAQMHYKTYFPASASSNDVRSFYENHHHHIINNELSLSLQFVPAHGEGTEKKRRGGSEDEEVDLELRL